MQKRMGLKISFIFRIQTLFFRLLWETDFSLLMSYFHIWLVLCLYCQRTCAVCSICAGWRSERVWVGCAWELRSSWVSFLCRTDWSSTSCTESMISTVRRAKHRANEPEHTAVALIMILITSIMLTIDTPRQTCSPEYTCILIKYKQSLNDSERV